MNNPSLDSFHGAISIWTWKLLSTIFLSAQWTDNGGNQTHREQGWWPLPSFLFYCWVLQTQALFCLSCRTLDFSNVCPKGVRTCWVVEFPYRCISHDTAITFPSPCGGMDPVDTHPDFGCSNIPASSNIPAHTSIGVSQQIKNWKENYTIFLRKLLIAFSP